MCTSAEEVKTNELDGNVPFFHLHDRCPADPPISFIPHVIASAHGGTLTGIPPDPPHQR